MNELHTLVNDIPTLNTAVLPVVLGITGGSLLAVPLTQLLKKKWLLQDANHIILLVLAGLSYAVSFAGDGLAYLSSHPEAQKVVTQHAEWVFILATFIYHSKDMQAVQKGRLLLAKVSGDLSTYLSTGQLPKA